MSFIIKTDNQLNSLYGMRDDWNPKDFEEIVYAEETQPEASIFEAFQIGGRPVLVGGGSFEVSAVEWGHNKYLTHKLPPGRMVSAEEAKIAGVDTGGKPISQRELANLAAYAAVKEESARELAGVIGWNQPLNTIAAFAGMFFTGSMTPTGLALSMALAKIPKVGPFAALGSLAVRGGAAIRRAMLNLRTAHKVGKMIKNAKATKAIATNVAKSKHLHKMADILQSNFVKQASIAGTGNLLEELMIYGVEQDKGYRYDLAPAAGMAFFAPVALKAFGNVLGIPILRVSDKVKATKAGRSFMADTKARLLDAQKKLQEATILPDARVAAKAKDTMADVELQNAKVDRADKLITKEETPFVDITSANKQVEHLKGINDAIADIKAEGKVVPDSALKAKGIAEAQVELTKTFGPEVNQYLGNMVKDMIKGDVRVDLPTLFPFLKSKSALKSRIKKLQDEGRIAKNKEDFSADDLDELFSVPERQLAKYIQENKRVDKITHKDNADAEGVEAAPDKIEKTFEEVKSTGDEGGKAVAQARDDVHSAIKEYFDCIARG